MEIDLDTMLLPVWVMMIGREAVFVWCFQCSFSIMVTLVCLAMGEKKKQWIVALDEDGLISHNLNCLIPGKIIVMCK